MTSIEWLEQIAKSMVINGGDLGEDYPALMVHIQQAKEMHKQEIIDFARHCLNKAKDTDILTAFINTQQYYQETFVSKGNDERTGYIKSETKLLGVEFTLEDGSKQFVPIQEPTSSQTTSDKWKEYQDWLNEPLELSDEEIMKGAKEWYNKEGAYSASAIALKTWVYAIKWYREQLKQKL